MIKHNKTNKQTELLDLMRKYVDENGIIDFSKFRVENVHAYRALYRYYKDVHEVIGCNGWVKNKAKKKTELLNLMRSYVDENGIIDFSKFRVENVHAYRTLYRYFKDVPEALECGGWIKNKEDKKSELLNLMSSYVDNNNMIDIIKFRLDHLSQYKSLYQQFGGVAAAIKQGGWIKSKVKKAKPD
jgi:hypothetical protein